MVQIEKFIVENGRRVRQELRTSDQSTTGQEELSQATSTLCESLSEKRTAQNVAMRLKDNEKKFSGDTGESWNEFVDEHRKITQD